MSVSLDNLIQQFQMLPGEQQIKAAELIDRLTWSKRWAAVCERIAASRQTLPPVSDEQIDQTVEAVRRERPLSARSSTLPS